VLHSPRFVLACALIAGGCALACGSSTSSPTPTATATSAPSTATLTGSVKDAVSNGAISGASVSAQNQSTNTAADGSYTLSNLPTGAATLTVQHQGHNNFSQAVTLNAGSNTVNVTMTPAAAALFNGNASGGWQNNTFGSNGPITATVAVNTTAQTISTTINIGGSVFGAGTPPTQTFTGPYNPTGTTTFSGHSAFFGTVVFNITTTGQVTGNMTSLPQANISRVDYTGTINPATGVGTGTYTVTFTNGANATGTVTVTRQ